MSCTPICKLCKNLVISTTVAFNSTDNTLNITIPNNNYTKNDKVCIVVAQTIPTTTTISALVNITVGTSNFPLLRCNGTQATACEIKTRTRYSTCVVTNTVSGAFRLLSKVTCTAPTTLDSLLVTTTTEGA